MTLSVLNDALLRRKGSPEEFKQYFTDRAISIFDGVFKDYEPEEARKIALYILCGYSEDSPLVIPRMDSQEEKNGICMFLDIDGDLKASLMNLRDPVIRRATTQYMMQFCGPVFRSYKMMEVRMRDMELFITNREYVVRKTEVDKEGKETITETQDAKEYSKAVTEHLRLAKQMEMVEKQLKAQVKRMDGIEELNDYLTRQKKAGKISSQRTGHIENFIQ